MVQIMMLRSAMTVAERHISEHEPFNKVQDAEHLLEAYEKHVR